MQLRSRANAAVFAAAGALFASPLPAHTSPDQQQNPIKTSELPAYATMLDGSRDAIPTYEAMWWLFGAVTAMEEDEATRGQKFLIDSIRLTPNSADGLVGHMRAAVGDMRIMGRKVSERTCSLRSELTSRAALADRLAQGDKELDRRREAHVTDIGKILTADEEAKVVAWVNDNTRTTMRIMKVDYAIYLDVEQLSPDMFLDRLCNPASATRNR